ANASALAGLGVVVDLSNTAHNTGEAFGDTYNSIENIRGSSFNDSLKGDAGANKLTGGLGADVFIYGTGGGADTITDFSHSQADRIDLTGVNGIFSLADVNSHATQNGANTVIDFGGGDTLTLNGVTAANLVSTDFAFNTA